MKRAKQLFSCMLLVAAACSSDNDAKKADCEASSATIFYKSATTVIYDVRENNHSFLSSLNVNDNTDSVYYFSFSYTDYALGLPSSVHRFDPKHQPQNVDYDATIDATKLTRLSGHISGSATKTDEYRFVYSGSQMTEQQGWYANTSGVFFQVSATKFTYDGNGNMTKSETYLDIVSLLTLAFGSNPTSYAPIYFGSANYEPSDSPNPLYGEFILSYMDWGVMKNLPKTVTHKDLAGSTTSVDNYVFTKDGNNYPTKAHAGSNKYLDATYVCR